MDKMVGLLRVHVKKGVDLAVRDVNTSDPYVVLKLGKQRVKTSVVMKECNPEWNEDLTLSISDPSLPIKLTVYDYDTFSMDDKMGEAEFDIQPFVEGLNKGSNRLPSGTIINKTQPGRKNCLAEESAVIWRDGKVVQDLTLRLKNVERGEVEIQLEWIDFPGAKAPRDESTEEPTE